MPEDETDDLLASLDDILPALAGEVSVKPKTDPPAPPVEAVAPSPPPASEEEEAVEGPNALDLFSQATPVTSALAEPEEPVAFDLDAPPPPLVRPSVDEENVDASDVLQLSDVHVEREVPDIQKPWMKHHKFNRVESVKQLREIVDAALKHGRCALDTETEGLDSRITYDGMGNPRTVHQIVGYCLSVDGVEGFYAPIRHDVNDGGKDLNLPIAEVNAEIARLCHASQPTPAPGALEKDPLSFKEWAEKPTVVIYFWNAKFDQEMLYPVTGLHWWHPESFEDGMLACFCDYTADKALSLKHKAPENLRDIEGNAYVMIELKELFIRGRPIKFNTLSPDEPGVLKYAGSDAICTYLLCEPPRKHEPKRKDYLKLARERYAFTYRLEKQDIQAVRGMERPRVKIDKAGVKELLATHQEEFARLLREIQNFANMKGYKLDPSSTQSLSNFLFGDGEGCLNLPDKPEKNEASGQYKTDGETLEAMVTDNPHAPPVLKWVVAYRGEEKILGTYLQHLWNNPDKNDELRFAFKEVGTGTGRFSAPAGEAEQGFSGIPIHGIPNESTMRKLFVARDGYTFVKADYSAQELRIAANVSGEPVWVKEFLEGDGDLHSITARAFFNKENISKDERKMGKIANFALIYGGGPQAIIRATGCDKVEASRRKQAFDKAVPTFAGWIKTQQKSVKKDLGVWTPFKRWLSIPDANVETGNGEQDRKIRAACERYAVNYPIQGSGADIMKISLVTLHKEFYKRKWLKTGGGDDSVRMLLTVHDEVVFEIKHERVTEAVPVIVEVMERPAKLARPAWRIPLVVEPLVGPNWGTGYRCERYEDYVKKCERLKKKPDIREGEDFVVNGFIYGVVREVDMGKEGPGKGEVEHHVDTAKKKTYIRILDPAWLQGASSTIPTDDAAGPAVQAPAPSPAPTPAPSAEPVATSPNPPPPVAAPAPKPVAPSPAAAPAPKAGRVVVIRMHRLTEETVTQVWKAYFDSEDQNGSILKLTDHVGTTLIDPSLRLKINPLKFANILDRKYNISNGRYEFEEN